MANLLIGESSRKRRPEIIGECRARMTLTTEAFTAVQAGLATRPDSMATVATIRKPVLAIDNDRGSIAAAEANAAANGVQVQLRHADLRTQAAGWTAAAGDDAGSVVVLANLLRPLLLEVARAMPRAPAQLIAGGLLPKQVAGVASDFAQQLGLHERERRQGGGWAAVWLSAR